MANEQFKNHNHHISFRLALSGLKYAITSQPNLKVMGLFAILALVLSFILNVSFLEQLVIVWTIFIVFVVELINTSLESITDLITSEWRQEAKIAKDVSSGMVLLATIGAAIIGLMVFLPRILTLR